jgi:hypothetical protein
MNAAVEKVQDTFANITESFKKSIQDSAQQTLEKAGATTPKEAEKILKNGGKVLEPKNPGKDLNNYIEENGGETGIYRYGMLMLVIALGVLAITRALPTEQIVKVVKNA